MDILRRADAKSASTEEEIEEAKCRFRNLEIEDAGIFPYLLSPFTESARALLSLVSKVSRSGKGERVKGKRAKGGEMGENEGGRDGHMARYRDNRSSKMGGTGARDTGPTATSHRSSGVHRTEKREAAAASSRVLDSKIYPSRNCL